MRKKFFLCLYLSTPFFLMAQEHPDKGAYGSLSFLYLEDDYTMTSTHTTEESFIQEFKLGYGGNIYSPKLLEYVVEATLRYEDEKMQMDNAETKQETKGIDYQTKFDFIKDTKTPFTLYANKSERPVNTVYSAYSQEYINETKSEGALGSINFNPYIFRYGATTTENIVESSGSLQNSKTTNYTGSLSYKEKAHTVGVDYLHGIEENQQYYIGDTIRSLDRVRDSLNLSYGWSGVEDLVATSGASYEQDDYFLSETMDANLNLYWRPKNEKYDTSFSIYGSNMEYGDGIVSQKYVFNSLNINQMFNYKLTETILLSENAMAYIYDASTVKGTNTYLNLYATHNYATTIFEDMPFGLTTRVGAQKNDTQAQTITGTLTDTTTSISVEKYNLDLMARVKKELPSIKSTLNMESGYYNSISSNDEEEQRYNAGIYLLSRLFGTVNNNINARYIKSDRVIVSYLNNEEIEDSYSMLSLLESLDYYYDINIRGRAKIGVGAEYISRKNNTESVSEVNPRLDANINYRLFRNWTFDANARVSQFYNSLDQSGGANLNFRAGKTTFLMGYQYNKSQIDSVLATIHNERSIFRVQLTREF